MVDLRLLRKVYKRKAIAVSARVKSGERAIVCADKALSVGRGRRLGLDGRVAVETLDENPDGQPAKTKVRLGSASTEAASIEVDVMPAHQSGRGPSLSSSSSSSLLSSLVVLVGVRVSSSKDERRRDALECHGHFQKGKSRPPSNRTLLALAAPMLAHLMPQQTITHGESRVFWLRGSGGREAGKQGKGSRRSIRVGRGLRRQWR